MLKTKYSHFLGIFLLFLFTVLLFSFKAPNLALSATNHIVISEVQISGVGGVNEDFIELYNPTDTNYDLNGHRLVKRTATGTTDTSIKAWSDETIIPPHTYYLWANNSWTPQVSPDASTAATLTSNNGIALRQGLEDSGTIIDSVAWGNATNAFVESSAFAINPEAGQSLERKPGESNPTGGNSVDTENNATDFNLRNTSDPQNSLSAIEIPTDASPQPSTLPSSSPTVIPSLEPSTTPEASTSPVPTPTVTPSATPTPSTTPQPSATITPSITPSATPISSPTPSPTPQPTGDIIFSGNLFTCRMTTRTIHTRFFTFTLPRIICSRN